MKTEKTSGLKNTFYVSVRPEGPYRVRNLTVAVRRRTSITSDIRACDCAEIERHLKKLQKQWGLDHRFVEHAGAASLRIEWLEHQDADGSWVACGPEIDAGEQYTELVRGLELLRAIGAVVERTRDEDPITDETFSNPDVVIAALRRSRKCIEVERFAIDRAAYWVETVAALAAEGKAA